MKKITLSVAALSIAISSFGQCEKYKIIHGETNEVKTLTKTEWVNFENEICGFTKFIDNSLCNSDSITFSKFEVIEIMNTLEEILSWQQEDMENGDTNMGKHSEGWGSNYWLTEMVAEMRSRYTGKNDYVQTYNK